MSDHPNADLLDRIKAAYKPSKRTHRGVDIAGWGGTPDEALVLVFDHLDPRLYAVPIPLTDLSRSHHYGMRVDSPEEWLRELGLGLMIQFDGGFTSRAARTQIDDYVELGDPGWPVDTRFGVMAIHPEDDWTWSNIRFDDASGLDPNAAVASRDSGELLSWVTAREHQKSRMRHVGQVLVVWEAKGVARLRSLETTPGLPVFLAVELARYGAHAARLVGAATVLTDLELPELALIGFELMSGGTWQLNTDFLNQDIEGAHRVHVAPDDCRSAVDRSHLVTPIYRHRGSQGS